MYMYSVCIHTKLHPRMSYDTPGCQLMKQLIAFNNAPTKKKNVSQCVYTLTYTYIHTYIHTVTYIHVYVYL
jgi:hypothetical protein